MLAYFLVVKSSDNLSELVELANEKLQMYIW